MAKKNFGTKLFATALATFALASCQSESTLLEPAANNLRDIELTITASKGELTRTNLNLSDDEKKLLLTWNLNDQIQVSETNGNYAGVLTVTKLLDEGKKAEFKGTVRTFVDEDGPHTFTFISLGKGVEYESDGKGKPMPNKVYDFSEQKNEGVDALAVNDLLMTTGDVEVKGGEATFNDLFMKREFGFGRFTLLYQNEPLPFDANTVVTVSKSDMKAGAEITFPTTVEAKGASSFTVTTSENDFYVTFVPGKETSPLEFTVTVGDIQYKGYSNPYLLEKNDFYRLAIEDGKELDTARAIPINVVRTDGYDDVKDYSLVYNQNFGTNPETVAVSNQSAGNECTFTVSDYKDLAFTTTNEYYDFVGWNTEADGTGTAYAANTTITLTDPTATLYALWTEHVWTVTWMDGYTDEPYKTATVKGEDGKNISGLYPADPDRGDDWKFMGWAPQVSTLDKSVSSYEIVGQWKQLYSVNWYDGYTTPETPINEKPVYVEDPNNIPSKDTPKDPTRPGFTFAGWDKVVDNETKTVKITAKWEQTEFDYTLIFADDDANPIVTITLESKTNPYTETLGHTDKYQNKTGYKQIGWNTNVGATEALPSVQFTDKNKVITLYPVWEQLPDPNTVATPGYTNGTFAQ